MSGKVNPYLAHLSQGQRGVIPDTQKTTKSEPLFGFLPRKVTANQVRKALVHNLNPFTKIQHTPQYRKLLEARRKLPVFAEMDGFFKMFNTNQTSIVSGELGTGKTTQIPQFVAFSDLPHTKGKIVACTQPRSEAVISLAKRVADEMDVQFGREVGCSTLYRDMVDTGNTFLSYMTDDVLLYEAINDPDLGRYSTIIIDEAQERTVATDILMGLLKSLIKRRSDLRVVIMTTPPYALTFRKYFSAKGGVTPPLFKVPVCSHPVEIFYTQEAEPDYLDAAVRTVLMIHRAEGPGDILLFLAKEEIEVACRIIKAKVDDFATEGSGSIDPLVCIPLYATLPLEQQQRVFDPSPEVITQGGPPARKVIVSTDIAAASLTIDGIVYVIDPGFALQKVYNPRIRVESLLVGPISKDLAGERAQRAGRTRHGKCFRLYTEKDYKCELEKQTYPEILRASLARMVLVMVNAGVKDLTRFEYVDAPAPELLMRALEQLNYLAALDDDGNVTALGRIMAQFPLNPQVSKILISSPEFQCSNEMLTIAAMLSVPSVWMRPCDRLKEANAAKALFTVPGGDHLTLLNVYNCYMLNKGDRNWVWNNYLSKHALEDAENVRNHLESIMDRFEIPLLTIVDERKRNISIRRALCCGFFMQVAHKQSSGYMTVKDNQHVTLHPSCGLDTQPEWVIYDEFILTTGFYLRTVSEVRPEWLLELAPIYFDPQSFVHGETRRCLQQVCGFRRVGDETGPAKKKKGKKKKKAS